MSFNLLLAVCLGYACLLFIIAFAAEKRARAGRNGWLRSPCVYTLSLASYCTGGTFYGAVGNAARSGLEFMTIYLGPTLVMVGWWVLLRRLVRIGRSERITSIADLISSRYGKSTLMGVLVTVLAVVGTTPYIALQLQSVTLAFDAFAVPGEQNPLTAFWVAAGLALFAVIFGTRNLDVNDRHHGVVIAIAVEAVVKLVALLAVGIFVVWGVAGGLGEAMRGIAESPAAQWDMQPDRWLTITFLAGAAFICLPRMFHVMVVENADESPLASASWAFPAYLFLISLFVLPIAVVGLSVMPEGANPDLFVLTVPLLFQQDGLAMLAFLGGFSAATSMVIVASLALSTMVSNHIVLPIWLSTQAEGAKLSGDVRGIVLLARRVSIAVVLLLGYVYYRVSGGGAALAAMGLIAFVGVTQVLPALLGGLFWRGATRVGAALGVLVGFAVWSYTLFLPSLGPDGRVTPELLENGPFGIGWLKPQALFGISGMDPLVHAVFWSLALNTLAFLLGSLLTFPQPLERRQGAAFANSLRQAEGASGWGESEVDAEDLLVMTQRILGPNEAQALFMEAAGAQSKQGYLPDATPEFLERLERELSGYVGAATAHAMIAQVTGGATVSVEDLMRVAGETQQMLEEQSQLQMKSQELERTARQLRDANAKLTQLSIQKDALLSQISHELRTPMTSIRAFSEILKDEARMTAAERQRCSTIIHDETLRLTRLLDDLLDLSVLENGNVSLNVRPDRLSDVISRAVLAVDTGDTDMRIVRQLEREDIPIMTDSDRLAQVFIYIISNAKKH